MSEFLICLDVDVQQDDLRNFESILARVSGRKPKEGILYLRQEDRRSCLRGNEATALERMVRRRLGTNPEWIAIDGLYSVGVNIALLATDQEVERLEGEAGFSVGQKLKI